jgi:hypothetical protein
MSGKVSKCTMVNVGIEIHWYGCKCKCHIWKTSAIAVVTVLHCDSLMLERPQY